MTHDTQPAHSTDDARGQAIMEVGGRVSLANPTYADEPFVDFASVTPETDLRALNLNWRERDLPERERTKDVHRLHPYLGKYIPQMVEIFLRKFTPRLVCDPFVGSGTTLVEAARLGVDSFGVDVSPFNCLLARVKTGAYDIGGLERDVLDILRRSAPQGLTLFGAQESTGARRLEPTPYIAEWFAPQAQEELLAYCALIPEYEHTDVLKVILSRSARSARMTPHHELDHPKAPQTEPYLCRKHKRICEPVREARKFLERYSLDTLRRIGEFARARKPTKCEVVCGDSRQVEFPPADLLITSPPYVGLLDYHEQHRYAYEFLSLLPEPFASVGGAPGEGRRNDAAEIGPARSGSGRAAREAYVKSITEVFARATARMPDGAHIVVVVNDKHALYEGIREALGFEEVALLNRHVNRRTGRRAGEFHEQVMVWRAG